MYDLLIGTRDWQNAAWASKFYPDNLPEDWRFCFYSNQFRSVLISGTVWESVTAEEINAWVEDSDKEFKIVNELPAVFSEADSIPDMKKLLLDFVKKTAPLSDQMIACLWQPAIKQLQQQDFVQTTLEIISNVIPVSVLLTGKVAGQAELNESNASICWPVTSVANGDAPEPHGQFLVTLCQENDLKRIRSVIEKLRDWMGEKRQAALFFEGDNALVQAQQARMIAELMAV